jgi:mannan endo-1,4-beta-mannosidase
LQASINKYYPGTKLAFTEFTYGGENDISGAIATADVIGIFAKYGIYYSAFWPVNSPSSYIPPAYKMYTDYDGSKSGFGGYYVPSSSSDSINCSIYGAINSGSSEMNLIVINKNFNEDIQGSFNISASKNFISGRVWELDSTGTAIKEIVGINNISGNTFSYTLPRASVCRFVLKSSDLLSIENSEGNSLPDSYGLSAYPNPFNPSCTIAYNVSRSRRYRIDIISIYGTLIRSYDNIAGAGNVSWNGTNMNNERVASGVYLAVLRSGGNILATQKLMLLK